VRGYRVGRPRPRGPVGGGEEPPRGAKIPSGGGPAPVPGGRVLIGLAPAGSTVEPRPAAEATWAGSYEVAVTPAHRGPHQARVVVEAIGEQHLHAPLVVEFPAAVGTAAGRSAAGRALLALVSGFSAVAVYAIALRAKLARPGESRVNLLEVDWLRRLLTAPALQPGLQVALLALMGILVLVGLTDVQDGGVNLATKLTWTIWW